MGFQHFSVLTLDRTPIYAHLGGWILKEGRHTGPHKGEWPLWGEEPSGHNRNFPLAENGDLCLVWRRQSPLGPVSLVPFLSGTRKEHAPAVQPLPTFRKPPCLDAPTTLSCCKTKLRFGGVRDRPMGGHHLHRKTTIYLRFCHIDHSSITPNHRIMLSPRTSKGKAAASAPR